MYSKGYILYLLRKNIHSKHANNKIIERFQQIMSNLLRIRNLKPKTINESITYRSNFH